jgi:hypothetical protein
MVSMLPPAPPRVTTTDYDPASVQVDEDADNRSEDATPTVEMSSVEINILIYLVRGAAANRGLVYNQRSSS